MRFLILVTLILVASAVQAADLPDPAMTPGATNPAVTQSTIGQTICTPGWTKTIRPPVSYTNKLKAQQMPAYGFPAGTDPSTVEEDHLISIELGGSPTNARNLWPQEWSPASGWGAHRKDVIETKLKRLVCSGTITLAEAQTAIRTDWIAAYHRFVDESPQPGARLTTR